MSDLRQTNEKGFTIIEVVFVLAIAALIFLMVFIALPSLQRSQRDNQRRQDISRVASQISNYSSSNRGDIPSTTNINNFVQKYLGGTGSTAGSDYKDPSTGSYVFDVSTTDPASNGTINYQTGKICGTDGAATATGASARSYVLRLKLEGQVAPYCVDNRS